METFDIHFPPQVPVPNYPVIEPGESGPDIIDHPEPYLTTDSGENLQISVKYANSKYPVRITWYQNYKKIGSKNNCNRSAETWLQLYGVQHSAKYCVEITDTYNGHKEDSFECQVHVSQCGGCVIV